MNRLVKQLLFLICATIVEFAQLAPLCAQSTPELSNNPRVQSLFAPLTLESSHDDSHAEGFALEDGEIPIDSDFLVADWPPIDKPDAAEAVKPEATPTPDSTKTTEPPKPPEKPKFPTIVVSGAAQIDGIWFDQNAANRAVVGEARDVAGFRRARIGALGNLAENVKYKMEYDFAFPGRPNFTDVWLDVGDLPTVGHFKVGQWKQPFSMEPATSFRELMFMERSLAFALVPFRQIGAGFYNTAFHEEATWAISGYRFPTDNYGNVAGDRGYGMSTRETCLVYFDDCGNTVHLGAGYTWNAPSTRTLRVRSTPEVGFTQLDLNNTTDFPVPFFVNTGILPCENYQVAGVEFAFGFGSLLYQSEYMHAVLNEFGGPSLDFTAGYAQLGYVLTGERRPYDRKTAAYTRVVPRCNFGKGGYGAFEVATRYSMIDLNDKNVQGGRLQDLTFGLNWYLNKYTRFEFNYVHPYLDRPVGNYTHANICAVRAQFDF